MWRAVWRYLVLTTAFVWACMISAGGLWLWWSERHTPLIQETMSFFIFVGWLAAGAGLTSLGLILIRLCLGLLRREESGRLVSETGYSGLVVSLVSWLTWLLAFLGIGALGFLRWEPLQDFFFGPVGFPVLVVLQVLLYLRLTRIVFRQQPERPGRARAVPPKHIA